MGSHLWYHYMAIRNIFFITYLRIGYKRIQNHKRENQQRAVRNHGFFFWKCTDKMSRQQSKPNMPRRSKKPAPSKLNTKVKSERTDWTNDITRNPPINRSSFYHRTRRLLNAIQRTPTTRNSRLNHNHWSYHSNYKETLSLIFPKVKRHQIQPVRVYGDGSEKRTVRGP